MPPAKALTGGAHPLIHSGVPAAGRSSRPFPKPPAYGSKKNPPSRSSLRLPTLLGRSITGLVPFGRSRKGCCVVAAGVSADAVPPAGPVVVDKGDEAAMMTEGSVDGGYRGAVPGVQDSEEMMPPPDKPEKLFKMLGLDTMSEEEMEASFNAIDKDGNGVLTPDEIEALVRGQLCRGPCLLDVQESRVSYIMQRFDINKDGKITHEEFTKTVHELANTIDRRVWIVAACMGAVGLGTGVMVPVLPKLVEQLGLSVQDMGLATSAKGAAQMAANLPAAWGAGVFGRVPMRAGGLLAMGIGSASLTVAAGVLSLAAARSLSGAASSIFSTAATAYVVDISNPLNRARSMANAFVLFSLGLMIGPLVGGVLSSTVGVHGALLVAAFIFAAMAAVTVIAVPETLCKEVPLAPAAANTDSDNATGPVAWLELIKRPGIVDMAATKFLNNAVQASAQFTLLPVLLTTELGLSPATVGSVFAAMAATGVVGTRFVGKLNDRIGGERLVAPGSLLKATALLLIPMVADLTAIVPLVLLWAAGNTLSTSVPRNFISINAPPEIRVQALAMLSTTGDLGFFVGGIAGGTAAKMTSVSAAMGWTGGLMLMLAVLFQARLHLRSRGQSADATPLAAS